MVFAWYSRFRPVTMGREAPRLGVGLALCVSFAAHLASVVRSGAISCSLAATGIQLTRWTRAKGPKPYGSSLVGYHHLVVAKHPGWNTSPLTASNSLPQRAVVYQ